MHTIHLQGQPPDMLQAYEKIKHVDTAALQVARHPASTLGFHADSWLGSPEQEALRPYGNRFSQAHFFISGTFNPTTRFTR